MTESIKVPQDKEYNILFTQTVSVDQLKQMLADIDYRHLSKTGHAAYTHFVLPPQSEWFTHCEEASTLGRLPTKLFYWFDGLYEKQTNDYYPSLKFSFLYSYVMERKVNFQQLKGTYSHITVPPLMCEVVYSPGPETFAHQKEAVVWTKNRKITIKPDEIVFESRDGSTHLETYELIYDPQKGVQWIKTFAYHLLSEKCTEISGCAFKLFDEVKKDLVKLAAACQKYPQVWHTATRDTFSFNRAIGHYTTQELYEFANDLREQVQALMGVDRVSVDPELLMKEFFKFVQKGQELKLYTVTQNLNRPY